MDHHVGNKQHQYADLFRLGDTFKESSKIVSACPVTAGFEIYFYIYSISNVFIIFALGQVTPPKSYPMMVMNILQIMALV